MNRRRAPMQYYQPSYVPPNPNNTGPYIPTPLPMPPPPAALPQSCFVPQNYYYFRYPGYQPYSQFAYTGLPFPGMDCYRMMTPLPAMQQPPVGFPYQLPPGYPLLRPPSMAPPTYNPGVSSQPPTSSCFDLLVANAGNRDDVNDVVDGDQSTTIRGSGNKPRTSGKTSKQKECHSSRSSEDRPMSRNRARYATSYRHKATRKHMLKTRRFQGSRSSFSTNEVSSIAKLNSADDDDYETCDDIDDQELVDLAKSGEESDWVKDTNPLDQDPGFLSLHKSLEKDEDIEKASNMSFLDYTLITNDKSYSYVNFNPDNLPKKLDHMWFEPRISELRKTSERCPISSNKSVTEKERNVALPGSTRHCVEKQHTQDPQMMRLEDRDISTKKKWDEPKKSCSEKDKQLGQACNLVNIHKTPPHLSICKPSGFENVININDTLEQERDLWWDNSTDIGCKSSAPTSKVNSSSSTHSKNSMYSDRFESDKTVLSKKATKESELFLDNDGKVEKTVAASQSSNHDPDFEPENEEKTINDVGVSGTYLHVGWSTTQKLVPQHYVTKTFEKGSFEKSDLRSIEASNIADSLENQIDRWNPDAARGELVDEDEAIVAVIQRKVEELEDGTPQNCNLMNPILTSIDKGNQERELFSDRFHDHVAPDMVPRSDDHNLRETMMSIISQDSETFTSGVKSLPCSPLVLDLTNSEPLFRSYSSSALDNWHETSSGDKARRVCTPHSKIVSNLFCRTESDKTFSLPLDRAKYVSFDHGVDAGKASGYANLPARDAANDASRSEQSLSGANPKLDLKNDFPTTTLCGSNDVTKNGNSDATAVVTKKTLLTENKNKASNTGLKYCKDAGPVSPAAKLQQQCTSTEATCQRNPLVLNEQDKKSCPNVSDLPPTVDSRLLKYMEKAAILLPRQRSVAGARDIPKTLSDATPSGELTSENQHREENFNCNVVPYSTAHEPEALVSKHLTRPLFTKHLPSQSTSVSDSSLSSVTMASRLHSMSAISTPMPFSVQSSKPSDTNATACVTRTGVHSGIKTRVKQLMDFSSRGIGGPIYSPCLASLQATGFNKHRFSFMPYQSLIFPSSKCAKRATNRTISLPSSPKRLSGLDSFQRSISLSDVFYDSSDDSSMLNSRSKQTISLSLSNISDSIQQLVNHENRKGSTYVSYPLPTLTPPDQTNHKEEDVVERYANYIDTTSQLQDVQHERDQIEKDCEKLQSTDEKETSFCSPDEYRSQMLDEATEIKLRKSAQDLIDSVNEKHQSSDVIFSNEQETNDQVIVKLPLSSNISSPVQDVKCEKRKVSTENPPLPPERKSLDQSTQTPERFLDKVHDEENPITNMVLPPKKPPRSKSPNMEFLKDDNKLDNKNVEALPLDCQLSTAAPTVSYYPFFAIAGPRRSEAHYISPSFIPGRFSQHIFRGPCVPPIPWCPLAVVNDPQSQNEVCLQKIEQSSKLSGTKALAGKRQDVSELPSCSGIPETGEIIKRTFNASDKLTGDKEESSQNPSVPYVLIPCSNRSKDAFPNPYPYVTRRRSFSGISSSAGARARLNRRNMNMMMAKRPYLAKPMKPRQINASHPTAKHIARRPRFVRSSLSEDTVYDLVKQRNGSFMTMPAKAKTLRPLRGKDCDNSNCHREHGRSGDDCETETGYSSEVSPEKEKVNTKKDEKHGVELKRSNCSRDATDNSQEKSQSKEMKKPNRFSTIQRTLKKMIPGKKQAKQASPFDELDPPTEHFGMKRSKTDSKLLTETDLHFQSGKRRKRELFGRSKKLLVLTDDDSTLKAESRLKTPVSLVKISSNSAKKIEKMSTSPAETSSHKPYEVKNVFFNPNPVHFVSSDANWDSGQQPSGSGAPTRDLTDCSAATIDPQSDNCSASTPGVRINSETGDVIGEEIAADKLPKKDLQNRRHHKLLSSTAIDE